MKDMEDMRYESTGKCLKLYTENGEKEKRLDQWLKGLFSEALSPRQESAKPDLFLKGVIQDSNLALVSNILLFASFNDVIRGNFSWLFNVDSIWHPIRTMIDFLGSVLHAGLFLLFSLDNRLMPIN